MFALYLIYLGSQEAALATSNISNVQSGYSTTTANQTNPYMASNMMYPMSGVYSSQDMSQVMSGQAAPNYMSSYSMYNMPPPPSLPPMPVVPGGPHESLSNVSSLDFILVSRVFMLLFLYNFHSPN